MMRRASYVLAAAAVLVIAGAARANWNPKQFAKQDTLEFLTVGPDEGEHWSTVWLVVLDGKVYIRLGSRAAERMQENTTAPYVKVRINGEEFDRVRAEPEPQMAERVAKAMRKKYWSDFLVRFLPHPLTMVLTPEEG